MERANFGKDQPSLLQTLMDDFQKELSRDTLQQQMVVTEPPDVADWMQSNFYVDRPRDPITAEIKQPGPIILAPYQVRVLREALSRNDDGLLKYSTVVWSEPKKSGKTAIGAAVGMYTAFHNSAINVYCLANDGKQSADRIYNAMARCVVLHNKFGGIFEDYRANISRPILRLDNGSVIEALPCDAAGEAGAEPFLTIWSELWGYAQQHKERMWTEMTIPSTLYGYAMRWVESYAGYEDESTTLWTLYQQGVKEAEPHPAFPDLPVYVNEVANQLTFWSHEPRQPWQTEDYYAAESKQLTPNEFTRIHRNMWVTSTSALFEDMVYWDNCVDTEVCGLPDERDWSIPIVVALDAGYATDCAAIYVVKRHPDDAWDEKNRRVCKCYSVAFKPGKRGTKLDFSKTLEPRVQWLIDNFNVYAVVYDPYQLHKMCTDMRSQNEAPFYEFSQAGDRLRADKQLYDMIIHRQFLHDGDPVDREHIQNTAKKEEGINLRFVKKVETKPIDLAVAASMAVYKCLELNI